MKRAALVALTIVLAASGGTVAGLCIALSPTQVGRCFFWGGADIEDYRKFPDRKISNAPPVFVFKNEPGGFTPSGLADVPYTWREKQKKVGQLEEFLELTGTTAFIIIKNDAILYEKYFNGYARDSINTSLSMAKSFDSALIGIAIGEGRIKGVEEPITNYLPELRNKGFDGITIQNLLAMSSGIKYHENGMPWGDDAMTYYFPDLRKLALGAKVEGTPGLHFHYNNFHPLLIGMILERATGMTVSGYLQEKIWKPLGMEFPASWSLDSEHSGFEKMESGINARSIDFAKFGRLFLNKGDWNGNRIVSDKWVLESTSPMPVEYQEYYEPASDQNHNLHFGSGKEYYKYFWWGVSRENGMYDFLAGGNLGQFIYVCPQKSLILVRNGKKFGNVDNWITLLYEMANKL